ncbi:MAG: glycosyltransferase family 4 protein [Candidatus Woesebacteria bacterium]|jgi:hypothetical protein
MKVCFYSPYIPKHCGGGEKYIFDCASILAKKHEVNIAIPSDKSLSKEQKIEYRKKYEKFLNHDLSKIRFIASPLGTNASFLKKLLWTRKFDLIYYATDGSLFFSLAKKNVLHVQVPFKLNKSSFIEKLKLANWQIKNTNSYFTKKIIEKYWPTKVDLVHQPMVEIRDFQLTDSEIRKKEKIILNVGRFFRQLHSKRQDVLVKIFKQLVKKYPQESRSWKLVLIGTVEDEDYAKAVKKMPKGLAIEIHHHLNRQKLINYYKKASIYWHATGYDYDEEEHPEKMEHFGITSIEAMASALVPIVIGKGGQIEILGKELENCSWQTAEECIEKTKKVINDHKLRLKLQKLAQKRANQFRAEIFEKKLWQMLENKI